MCYFNLEVLDLASRKTQILSFEVGILTAKAEPVMKQIPPLKIANKPRNKRNLFLLFLPLVLPAAFLVARYFPRTVVTGVTAWEHTRAADEIGDRVALLLYSSINRRPYANTYIVRSVILVNGAEGIIFDVEYNRSAGTLQMFYEKSVPANLYENVTDSAIGNLTKELAKPISIEDRPAFGLFRLPSYGCKLTKRYVHW
jgi:hypothetical protein